MYGLLSGVPAISIHVLHVEDDDRSMVYLQ